MEIQLISMGDNVSFVVLPGEPVAELARNLRALVNKSESTFVLGYTNGLIGYLPTDIMIEEGGYETEGSRFVYLSPSALDSGSEPAIISATKDCITDSLEVEKSNGYGRYHLAHGEQKAFFVLSAGRCGTMTLAHILDTATNARVWHHPQPDPIRESLLAYWGDIDKRKAFWKARYSIIHKTWSEGLIHGETDLLMTPFCDMIAEEIPDSKFIVLVRDPRDFVRSGMRRNYYQGHAWDFGRLRPKEDTKEFARWNRLDQFRKVCWLWNKTYQTINQIVDRIAKERVFTVRFKDLITGNDNAEKIFKFLGLEGFNEERIQKLLSKKLNAQVSGTFPKPEDWPKQLNETLWNECGSIADEFGYSITYGARKSTKCTRNNQLIDLKGKPCKQTLERDHPSSLINQEGIQANGQSCTDLMLTRNRKKPNIAEKTCVSSIAFLSLFKSLNIKEYGYSDERLPFVQLDNGLKFYGLPNNESVNSFYDDLDQDIRKEFSRDIVAVILDIKNRFYKQKQHRKFQYRQGNTVLELGAYLGYYSMYVAQQVGPSGRVIAVEFLPENYQLLEKNLLENFPKSTQPVLKGIWSEKTKKTVYCGGSQLNSFKEEVVSLYTKHMETIEVETDTVDNITSSYNIKEIDLVIIQLNGNELEALKGMRYSLSFTKNLAIAANYDSEGSNACDVICNFLHKNGFITEVTDRWVYAKQKKKHYTLFESQKCPIFIGGCGRSGTTLMRVMLDSHKNIACGPESYLAVKDNINIADLSFKFDMPAVEIEQLAKKSFTKSEFIDNFLSTYALLNGKKRWAEKTPKNVYRIDYIFNQFKNAKFIHMIRDGRDVACSLRTHPRFKIANGELVPTNICHPIEMGISRWIKDTTAGLLGRNFKGYIEVKYEDLVLNNEETLKKLFDFLEEPWDVNVLNYYRIKSGSRDVNKAPQNPEAFKEIQLDSLGRWYREFLPQDVAIFKEMAGDLLIYLGYVTSYSWDLSMSKRQRG
ncbi:MAG: FkbM family methyltransferase [Thermodesulfobacteriota bacterium]|nr:FkbM family methyltransferase [Thermodesulfobacteriota bacterium]